MIFNKSNSSVDTFATTSDTKSMNTLTPLTSSKPRSSKDTSLRIPLTSIRESAGYSLTDAIKALRRKVSPSSSPSSSSQKPKESGTEALERLRRSSGHPSVQAYRVTEKVSPPSYKKGTKVTQESASSEITNMAAATYMAVR